MPLTPPAAARRLPSMPALVFFLMVLILPGAFGSRMLNADGDLARHLRQGGEILESGDVIRTDRFSWPKAGEPFVSFEYGSQVLFALTERAAGLAGVVLLATLLLAGAHALLTRFLLRRGVDPLLALLVAAFSAMVAQIHWIARPHLITIFLTVVLLDWLDQERRRPWWQFALLYLVWANLHAGFIFGLGLMGVWMTGEFAEGLLDRTRRAAAWAKAGQLALALVASTAVTFANAYGAHLHQHAYGNLSDEYMKNHTSEFQSPNFHWVSAKVFLAALLAILGGALASRRSISGAHWFVIVVTVGLSLIAGRNITLFAITGLPLAALHLAPYWNRLRHRSRRLEEFSSTAAMGSTVPWVAAVVAVVIVLAAARGSVAGRQLVPNAFVEPAFPVGLVRAARTAGLPGRLFNDFRYGGYVQYAWPEQKVFIDGATDFYGGQHQRKYTNVMSLVPGWRDSLDAWQVTLVLVPILEPLASELARDAGWSVWRCDGTAALLRRTSESPDASVLAPCIKASPLPRP